MFDNIGACSHNHCCCENATMLCVCVCWAMSLSVT